MLLYINKGFARGSECFKKLPTLEPDLSFAADLSDSKNETCMVCNNSFHPFPVGNQIFAHNLVSARPGHTCCLIFLFTVCTESFSPST